MLNISFLTDYFHSVSKIHLHFNYDICHIVISRDYSLLADLGQQKKYNYELHLSQNVIIL